MQRATIGWFEGQLVIIPSEWETIYDEPKLYRHYWPTGIRANSNDARMGIEGWLYDSTFKSGGDHDYETYYLPQGGQTKSVYVEIKDAKPPRRNKKYDWKWECGKWVKKYI